MSSDVTLDTLQDKQMLDDFVEAKRVGKCGIMGDRLVNNRRSRFADSENNKTMLYGCKQPIRPCKDANVTL